jgi:hypothetical protein
MIPSDLRGELDRFFGAPLSRVRVSVASPLPASVDADAVAWNDQIWLADPAPDFSRRETVRVLVHELAHIGQQRAGRRLADLPAAPVAVGDPRDRLEAEADACAAAFFAGRPCPPLTADRQPFLRRVLSITPNSAKLTFNFGQAKPAAALPLLKNKRFIVAHLTAGFTDANTIAPAITWTGKALVTSKVSNPAELTTLRFGFIQIQRVDKLTLTYVGRTPADGEADIKVAPSPNPALDSFAAFSPFMNAKIIPVKAGVAEATAADHPGFEGLAILANTQTGANNFLFEMTDARTFFTVFTAQDVATKKFQHLAHHSWELIYKFRLIWRNGTPQIFSNSSSLKPAPAKAGAPTDAAVAALLANPKPPFATDAYAKAMGTAIATRNDSATRTTSVPSDFFL